MPKVEMTAAQKIVYTLLDAVTSDVTSNLVAINEGSRTVQASITGTGTVSGTVSWYGSNIRIFSLAGTEETTTRGILCATSTLSGTNKDDTGTVVIAEWPYMYCVLSDITGTDATVTATIGG